MFEKPPSALANQTVIVTTWRPKLLQGLQNAWEIGKLLLNKPQDYGGYVMTESTTLGGRIKGFFANAWHRAGEEVNGFINRPRKPTLHELAKELARSNQAQIDILEQLIKDIEAVPRKTPEEREAEKKQDQEELAALVRRAVAEHHAKKAQGLPAEPR
ncbi:MAG: hypothetical protein FWF24_00920 [Alphaproteobacteria bacterium]|nr:hypothetical protein [Alphaproteobacteria bacterium]